MTGTTVTATKRLAFPSIPDPPRTEITYGTSYIDACTSYISETLHAKRVFILASNSMSKMTDYVTKLEEALGKAHAGTSTAIRAHTFLTDLIPIMKEVNAKQVDCIVTMGGSSIADGAQIIAYAVANGVCSDLNESEAESLSELIKYPTKEAPPRETNFNGPKIPMIFIPTSLSGGEYSMYAAGTNPNTHEKLMYAHNKMYASLIILDPAITSSTPEWVWLSTGVRAIDHCVEVICSPGALSYTTTASKEGLQLLLPGLLASKRNPNDLDAKLKCMLGCNLSLTGLICSVFAGGSHGIGHQLGPIGVGHGQTSCILMPAVQKYNARVNHTTQEDVKRIFWDNEEVREVMTARGLEFEKCDLGDSLDAVFRELGMPRSLKDVGVGRENLGIVADNSTRDFLCIANPIPLTKPELVMEILEMVVGDGK